MLENLKSHANRKFIGIELDENYFNIMKEGLIWNTWEVKIEYLKS